MSETQQQRVWHSLVAVALVLLAIGCNTESAPVEPGFQRQLDAVKAGKTDEIHVETEPVGDRELAFLAGLDLRRLELHQVVASAAAFEYLEQVNGLEHLVLRGGTFDDEAVARLSGCKSLVVLNLPDGEFTDAGLAELQTLPKLELLRFHSPHVTDAGLQHIAKLESLRFLHLIGVPITDEGLQHLKSMKQLESFYVDDSNVTGDGIERLLQALPELHVHINQQHSDRDPNRHSHQH